MALLVWVYYSFQDYYIINKKHISLSVLKTLTTIKTLFNHSTLRKIYLLNFIIFFSVMGLYRVVPLYIVDRWHPSLHIYAILIAYVSLICFFSNLIFLGNLAKYFSPKKLLSVLLFFGGLIVIMIVIPDNFHWIWLTYGLAVIPTVMALPICTSWLSGQVSSQELGQVLGNNQALLVLGEASSAAIGGLIAAIFIPLPIILIGIILLMTGAIIGLLM